MLKVPLRQQTVDQRGNSRGGEEGGLPRDLWRVSLVMTSWTKELGPWSGFRRFFLIYFVLFPSLEGRSRNVLNLFLLILGILHIFSTTTSFLFEVSSISFWLSLCFQMFVNNFKSTDLIPIPLI